MLFGSFSMKLYCTRHFKATIGLSNISNYIYMRINYKITKLSSQVDYIHPLEYIYIIVQ